MRIPSESTQLLDLCLQKVQLLLQHSAIPLVARLPQLLHYSRPVHLQRLNVPKFLDPLPREPFPLFFRNRNLHCQALLLLYRLAFPTFGHVSIMALFARFTKPYRASCPGYTRVCEHM